MPHVHTWPTRTIVLHSHPFNYLSFSFHMLTHHNNHQTFYHSIFAQRCPFNFHHCFFTFGCLGLVERGLTFLTFGLYNLKIDFQLLLTFCKKIAMLCNSQKVLKLLVLSILLLIAVSSRRKQQSGLLLFQSPWGTTLRLLYKQSS